MRQTNCNNLMRAAMTLLTSTRQAALLLLVAVLATAKVQAQESKIIVWLNDGTKTEVPFDGLPEFIYQDGSFMLTTGEITRSWPLEKLIKFTFESALPSFIFADTEDNGWAVIEKNDSKCNITLHRTLVTGSYNTFAVPFDVSAETLGDVLGAGTKAKQLIASSLNDGELTLSFADADAIEAGRPYLIKVPANVTNPVFENVTVSSTVIPATTTYADFVPTIGKTLVSGPVGHEDDAGSVLILGADNKLYQPATVNDADDEGCYMKGFRAYFRLKDAAAVRSFRMDLGDDPTGIVEVRSAREDSFYTLDGRHLNSKPVQKGVYIHNGEKKVIK